jgi:hypothetical protein
MKSKNIFSVRTVILLPKRGDQKLKFLYEERLTIWAERNVATAVKRAEKESRDYVSSGGGRLLNLTQAFWLHESAMRFSNGVEIFSLIRESDLTPSRYVKQVFATGFERERL